MSELGDKFLLALVHQGYHFTVDDEDVTIWSHKLQYHVPRILFSEPELEPALRWAIASFASTEPFDLTWVRGTGWEGWKN